MYNNTWKISEQVCDEPTNPYFDTILEILSLSMKNLGYSIFRPENETASPKYKAAISCTLTVTG
jgi:hypothetical protein